MFFHILILPAGSTDSAGLTYGYYKTLPAAKESLMNWARGVLALHPDKRYSEIPADPRSTEKILLRVAIAAPGKKPAYEGIIVEHAFADEDGAGFVGRLNRICAEARDAACEALAPGETVKNSHDIVGTLRKIYPEGDLWREMLAAIAAPGKKPAYEGIIVEHAFADEDKIGCILEEKKSKN